MTLIEKERQEIVKIVNEALGEDTFNVALDAVRQLANEYKAASRRSYEKSVIIEELQTFIKQKDARIEELEQEVKLLKVNPTVEATFRRSWQEALEYAKEILDAEADELEDDKLTL